MLKCKKHCYNMLQLIIYHILNTYLFCWQIKQLIHIVIIIQLQQLQSFLLIIFLLLSLFVFCYIVYELVVGSSNFLFYFDVIKLDLSSIKDNSVNADDFLKQYCNTWTGLTCRNFYQQRFVLHLFQLFTYCCFMSL